MPDYSDTLAVHLDRIADEGGAFALIRDGKGWTATGTRKGGRKDLTASAGTAIAAAAGLLTKIRAEVPELSPETSDDGA